MGIYNFPFKTPALVAEKDAVFIPAGWDNNKKIAILYENMHSVRPDQYYTDVIARPMSGLGRKPVAGRDVEVVAEEEQQFLSRQQQFLSQGLPPQQSGAMPSGWCITCPYILLLMALRRSSKDARQEGRRQPRGPRVTKEDGADRGETRSGGNHQ